MFRRSIPACPALAALGLAAALALGAVPSALANGRLPSTVSINFRQGHDSDIVAGLTFGLVFSHDGGATWTWMCDDAIGIGNGPYDPQYVYAQSNAVFATTLAGLVVARDRCTFAATPEGKNFVSANAVGPDGAYYYAASQTADTLHGTPADFKIYKSTDDGATFPVAVNPANPADTNVYWSSLMVAPNNAQVVYVSGFRFVPDGSGGTKREHMVFRSDTGGTSWSAALPLTGLTLAQNSQIRIVGIASDAAKHVYARVDVIDNTTTDALYVSDNSGATWTEIHRQPDRFIAFVARAATNGQGKHDLIAVTTKFGPEISHDDGASWAALAGAPHIACLSENAAHELWACTQNYDLGQVAADGAGIMKTTDLATWTKVLRYEDLTEISSCGADTVQQKTCSTLWCGSCVQLHCTPAASYACPGPAEAPIIPPMTKGGCCDAGSAGSGPLALALSVATVLLRPRRRRDLP